MNLHRSAEGSVAGPCISVDRSVGGLKSSRKIRSVIILLRRLSEFVVKVSHKCEGGQIIRQNDVRKILQQILKNTPKS